MLCCIDCGFFSIKCALSKRNADTLPSSKGLSLRMGKFFLAYWALIPMGLCGIVTIASAK